MYNQYLDDSDFVLLDEPAQTYSSHPPPAPPRHPRHHPAPAPAAPPPREPPRQKNDLIGEITGGLGQLLSGVLKHFSLESFDTGDILLVLIILFLYLEGDNLELVITLGLLLLRGLGDDDSANEIAAD